MLEKTLRAAAEPKFPPRLMPSVRRLAEEFATGGGDGGAAGFYELVSSRVDLSFGNGSQSHPSGQFRAE